MGSFLSPRLKEPTLTCNIHMTGCLEGQCGLLTVKQNSVLISSLRLLLKTTAHHTLFKNKHFRIRNLTTTLVLLSYHQKELNNTCPLTSTLVPAWKYWITPWDKYR